MATFGIRKSFDGTFDEALTRVPEALKTEGFGVLTEIDMQATLKATLGVDFRRYRILGACNPPLAQSALQAELEIGLMLPCNVILQEVDEGHAEVSAVDPIASMQAVSNPGLSSIAGEVRDLLKQVVDEL